MVVFVVVCVFEFGCVGVVVCGCVFLRVLLLIFGIVKVCVYVFVFCDCCCCVCACVCVCLCYCC